MKTSCIAHPENEPLIIVRRWQLEACGGNRVAAALLSFFEYWHNFKLMETEKQRQQNAIREAHGEPPLPLTLWQFHSQKDLEDGLLIFKRDAIAEGIKKLVEIGFLETGKNPNPRYAFDRTRYFLFKADVVNEFLHQKPQVLCLRSTESRSSLPESRSRSTENPSRSTENRQTITEITYEITHEKEEATPNGVGANTFAKPKASRSRVGLLQGEELENWLTELQNDLAYSSIAVRMEYAKMIRWCEVNKHRPTKRRFISWLNRIDTVSQPAPAKQETPQEREARLRALWEGKKAA